MTHANYKKALARGGALVILAIALAGAPAIVSAEPTDKAIDVVAPATAPNTTRGLVAAPAEPNPPTVLPTATGRLKDATRLEQPPRSRVHREVARVPRHRSGGGIGIILGVGY
jgi:hypothetical protein